MLCVAVDGVVWSGFWGRSLGGVWGGEVACKDKLAWWVWLWFASLWGVQMQGRCGGCDKKKSAGWGAVSCVGVLVVGGGTMAGCGCCG